MESITRPTILEVNLDNFKYNIEQIKKKIEPGTTIMPIIKANAYGTYINKKLEILNEFEIVGVAIVDEAVEIRKLGYKKDIFVLNQPSISEISKIIEHDIVVGISSDQFLKALINQEKDVRVHIEIETGMGRTGVFLNNIESFVKQIKEAKNIKVEGVYSHLSSADSDDQYTKQQIKNFEEATNIIKKYIPNIKYTHISASNGIINYPSKKYNLVRAGMIMYGYESGEGIKEKIDLKPVCKLKSEITYIKEVESGTSISYGRKFITKRKSKIATIPIGYADGLRRGLSNKGFVVINNKKAPIIGSVCMDSCMVDVTDIEDVKVGDDVYIWDNKIITLEEISSLCSTINYEILSTISARIPRKFIL